MLGRGVPGGLRRADGRRGTRCFLALLPFFPVDAAVVLEEHQLQFGGVGSLVGSVAHELGRVPAEPFGFFQDDGFQ